MLSPRVAYRGETDVGGRVLDAASRLFGVTTDELRSSKRVGLSEARWAISFVLVDRCGWSSLRVGELLSKDHTAILYGLRRARELRRLDEPFFEATELMMEAI